VDGRFIINAEGDRRHQSEILKHRTVKTAAR
jgi:hypothetical protein